MAGIWQKTKTFFEMIKFEHSIFALPFAYLGLVLGEKGWPRFSIFFWVTLAMVSFRTMGMALNRVMDLSIDAMNPRTQARALPAGKLKISFVRTAIVVSFFIFEIAAYQLGTLCFRLSPIPVLLAILYPLTKRFTWFSHMVLGIILGIAPYGAWIASRGTFSWIPGLLTLGVTAWVAGFDMIYALQDIEFDRHHGLFSFPSRFSIKSALAATKILHLAALAAWLGAGMLAGLGPVFFIGMGIVTVFLIREHWLVHSKGLTKIDEAFFTTNAFVSVLVFLAVVADFVF